MIIKKMLPFCIMDVLAEETDEQNTLRQTEIFEKVRKRYGEEVIKKEETVKTNIELINDYFIANGKGEAISIGKGEKGRYKGNWHYHLDHRPFLEEEIFYLHWLILGQKTLAQADTIEIAEKLESMLSRHQKKRLRQRVENDGTLPTTNRLVYLNLEVINDAIAEKKNIQFEYHQYNLKKKLVKRNRPAGYYLVSPYALAVSKGKYYFFGHHLPTNSIRTYRVDKMMKTTPDKNGTAYVKGQNVDMKSHSQQAVNMYSSTKLGNITLRCSMDILDKVVEQFRDCYLNTDKDPDYFIVSIRTVNLDGSKEWIRENCHCCEVIKPQSLRDELKAELEQALAFYK